MSENTPNDEIIGFLYYTAIWSTLIGAINVDQIAVYRLHIAYRKIFRYIFNLPLWAHISELLEVFNIESVESIICSKRQRISTSYITSRFN